MALPVLQNIATVFGATVPAYQEARKFVLESQKAALSYRISVAELLIRARTQELANEAKMRAAAADAIDTVRKYAIDGPVYNTAMIEMENANVRPEQIEALDQSFRDQGFITDDDLGYIFDLTKADRPDDGSRGGGSGSGRTPETLDQWLEFNIDKTNSQLISQEKILEGLLDLSNNPSAWESMNPDRQASLANSIIDRTQAVENLRNDYTNLNLARGYARDNPGATWDQVRRMYPLSWYNEGGTAPTTPVSRPTPTGTPVVNPSSPSAFMDSPPPNVQRAAIDLAPTFNYPE